MSRSLRALVASVCLMALPAAAESAEVRKFLNAATAAYENLEYEKALKQVAKAKGKAATAEDEVSVGLLEGIVLADMGREDKSLEAFKAAFGLDLEAKLPLDVSPKVQAVAEKARTAVRKVLAPTLEQQRLAAEQAEKKRLEEERAEADRKAKEAQAREDEAQRAKAAAAAAAAASSGSASTSAPKATAAAPAPSGGLRSVAWIPGVVGGVAAVGAGVFLFSASGADRRLRTETFPYDEAVLVRQGGQRDAMLGLGLGVVAAVGAATMVGFLVAGGGSTSAAVSVAPVPGGVMVGVGGTFGEGARP